MTMAFIEYNYQRHSVGVLPTCTHSIVLNVKHVRL